MTEPTPVQEAAEKPTRNPFKRLYHWVLKWSESRHAGWALFLIAFAESSFFPVPPDVLLLPLCLGDRKKAFKFALICTIGSVLGGIFGYFIGWALREPVAEPFIDLLGLTAQYHHVQVLYEQYAGLAVGAAALTPLPYKLFTISAGVCGINLGVFILASVAFRGLRFFVEAVFIWKFGLRIRKFIERYFWLATTIFFALLVGGFVVVRHMAGSCEKETPAREQKLEQHDDG